MSQPSVSVGLRKGRVFVIPTYSPGPGTYIHREPVRQTTPDEPESIGQCVRDAIADFVDGGQMPDWSIYRSPVLAAAGVEKWSDYEKGLRDCIVKEEADHLVVRGDREPREMPLTVSNEELGRAILQALGAPRRYWR